jgi:hypothetical protein
MALLTPVFLDASVMVPGLIDLGEPSEKPRSFLLAIAEGRIGDVHTAWHCCLEFYAVSTALPDEYRLEPDEAERVLAEGILKHVRVHQLHEKAWRPFLASAVRERVRGGRVYDTHIAETALQSGARTVVTENVRHFGSLSLHGIRVLAAADVDL